MNSPVPIIQMEIRADSLTSNEEVSHLSTSTYFLWGLGEIVQEGPVFKVILVLILSGPFLDSFSLLDF